jgi:hypothetical protein
MYTEIWWRDTYFSQEVSDALIIGHLKPTDSKTQELLL